MNVLAINIWEVLKGIVDFIKGTRDLGEAGFKFFIAILSLITAIFTIIKGLGYKPEIVTSPYYGQVQKTYNHFRNWKITDIVTSYFLLLIVAIILYKSFN